MVARGFSEGLGKVWARASAREGEDDLARAALADGNVSVRTEAVVAVAPLGLDSGAAGFFSAAVFSELCLADGADGFEAGAISRRAGWATAFGCSGAVAAQVEEDDEESGRWPRSFGSARRATMTKRPAAT